MINKMLHRQNEFLCSVKLRRIIFVVFILLIIGQLLNFFWTHKLFHINQGILLFMLFYQTLTIQKINKEKKLLNKLLTEAQESELVGLLRRRVDSVVNSLTSFIVTIILVIFYIVTMYVLGCIEYSVTGIYGGILGALVFYIGIQAYLHYLSLVYFSYELRNKNINSHFTYIPALTDWLGKLAEVFSYVEKRFLLLGFLYTLVYAINVPLDIFDISNGITINSNNNFLFIGTWIGILLLFVIALPVLTFLTRSFITYVIHQLKSHSMKILEQKIKILSMHSDTENLETIERYLNLVQVINQSPDYPLKYGKTVIHRLYTVMMALITLVGPFLSIIEKSIFEI